MQLTARIGYRGAKQRVAIGTALAPVVDLRGDEPPATTRPSLQRSRKGGSGSNPTE